MSYSRTRNLSFDKRMNRNKKQISRLESKVKMSERPDWDDSMSELSSLRLTPEEMRRRHSIHLSHNNISNRSSLNTNDFNDNNERKFINQMRRSESNPNISSNKTEVNHKISVLESMRELYNKLSTNNSNKSTDGNQFRPHFLAMIVKSLEDINQKVDELRQELRKEKSIRLQLENKVNDQEIIIDELIKDLLRVDPILRTNAINTCFET